ncbi:pyridoxamine 5'-phosphate oxidase family protein [Lacrimispora sphenoides]|uniref:Pyridoxamine 5'-phosphate oxidase n=1 Tax=Lacrimispora sphenoides JCM 1415 TaxID=1297793 RepID=A0ABY1C2Q4_9FIRM|nr:pyridoxamine 5'-phosphate oxidase family protein [Lacrimispora sphenoides]SET57697.1 Pyridoxamine 5'-phosphate oxidase [[Clostridium] sphenoides JCM 1415]SUY49860.1 putative pyridoxine phosphate protein [Lacrimispora sphenoides]
MNAKQEFTRMINTQTEIALATCTDGQPNVRIVNFCFDEAAKVLLFTTFEDNEKVKELEHNHKVAFTTIPHAGNEHIKAKGTVKKSSSTVFDKAEHFIKKIPGYKDMIEQAGDYLILYEISFDSAVVTLDFENIETYDLDD